MVRSLRWLIVKRPDDVVGDHAAGVAQHVHLAEVQPEEGEDVDARVHAGQHDRAQRRRRRHAVGVGRSQVAAAGLVALG